MSQDRHRKKAVLVIYVTAECEDPKVMYDPEIWPTGAYIRRYYEPRRQRGTIPTDQGAKVDLTAVSKGRIVSLKDNNGATTHVGSN